MQRSNPHPSQADSTSLSAALEQAFARAAARSPDVVQPLPNNRAAAEEACPDVSTKEQALTSAELFRLLREPIDWLLSLADRLAITDPADLAAVERVRAAILGRLSGQPAGLRATDVLIVFGLLVSALDPAVVIRAVSGTLGEGLAAVLASELPISFFASASDPLRFHPLCACCRRHAGFQR